MAERAPRGAECPRCKRSNVTKCSKANGYCVRCDDETSYDYCTPKSLAGKRAAIALSKEAMFSAIGSLESAADADNPDEHRREALGHLRRAEEALR